MLTNILLKTNLLWQIAEDTSTSRQSTWRLLVLGLRLLSSPDNAGVASVAYLYFVVEIDLAQIRQMLVAVVKSLLPSVGDSEQAIVVIVCSNIYNFACKRIMFVC